MIPLVHCNRGGEFMANIKSAKKRVLVSNKKNLRNRIIKSALKTTIKKYETAVNENKELAASLLPSVVSAIDKAAAKGILHKNSAARKKSFLAKQLH
jgi:small subunit ribosomal protein S20